MGRHADRARLKALRDCQIQPQPAVIVGMINHPSYTIVCDHENLALGPDQFGQLHRCLASMAYRSHSPHFIARAGWDWGTRRTHELAQALDKLGYIMVTCSPGPDAADAALRRVMKLDTWKHPRTVLYLGGDHFFAGIAERLRNRQFEIVTVTRNRETVSRSVVRFSDRVLTLDELAIYNAACETMAPADLPRELYVAAEALVEMLFRLGGRQRNGSSGWVSLERLNGEMRHLSADARPAAAGCRSVFVLAERCAAYNLIGIRRQPGCKTRWQLRSLRADINTRVPANSGANAA